jgi:hypothetical protein
MEVARGKTDNTLEPYQELLGKLRNRRRMAMRECCNFMRLDSTALLPPSSLNQSHRSPSPSSFTVCVIASFPSNFLKGTRRDRQRYCCASRPINVRCHDGGRDRAGLGKRSSPRRRCCRHPGIQQPRGRDTRVACDPLRHWWSAMQEFSSAGCLARPNARGRAPDRTWSARCCRSLQAP